jgi:hypothetical protein
MNDMRTITIQADGGPGGNDDVMRGALRYIVTTMPVSDKGLSSTAACTTARSSTTASPVSGW